MSEMPIDSDLELSERCRRSGSSYFRVAALKVEHLSTMIVELSREKVIDEHV
jgi:hypothetical protein